MAVAPAEIESEYTAAFNASLDGVQETTTTTEQKAFEIAFQAARKAYLAAKDEGTAAAWEVGELKAAFDELKQHKINGNYPGKNVPPPTLTAEQNNIQQAQVIIAHAQGRLQSYIAKGGNRGFWALCAENGGRPAGYKPVDTTIIPYIKQNAPADWTIDNSLSAGVSIKVDVPGKDKFIYHMGHES